MTFLWIGVFLRLHCCIFICKTMDRVSQEMIELGVQFFKSIYKKTATSTFDRGRGKVNIRVTPCFVMGGSLRLLLGRKWVALHTRSWFSKNCLQTQGQIFFYTFVTSLQYNGVQKFLVLLNFFNSFYEPKHPSLKVFF